jgi:nicotinamidase-related amidase
MSQARRGKSARKKTTALVLVDFINLFDFDDAGKLAPRALRAAKRTAALKQRLKRRGVPCIYANDNFGRWTSDFAALTEACLHRQGPAAEIAGLLHPAEGDLAVLKPRHSAFYGTPLDFLLEDLNVAKIVLAGIAVDMCVFATAQDAYVREFKLWIPSDCTAGFTRSQERASLAHMARTLKADIRPAISRN